MLSPRTPSWATFFLSLREGFEPWQKAAAEDFVLSTGHAGDGFAVGDMLLDQDARGEGVGVVSFEDRDGALQDNDAMVQVLIDEMNGATGYLNAVFEGLALRFEAGKGRK
jgi:hypothetical protein